MRDLARLIVLALQAYAEAIESYSATPTNSLFQLDELSLASQASERLLTQPLKANPNSLTAESHPPPLAA